MRTLSTRIAIALALLSCLTILAAPALAENSFEIRGCVVSAAFSGDATVLTVEDRSVVQQLFCSHTGLLGKLCPTLAAGDCAVFRGEFPATDSDIATLGVLELKAVLVGGVDPVVAGQDPPPGDQDGNSANDPTAPTASGRGGTR